MEQKTFKKNNRVQAASSSNLQTARIVTMRVVVLANNDDAAIERIENALGLGGIDCRQTQFMAVVSGDKCMTECMTEAITTGFEFDAMFDARVMLENTPAAIPTGIDYVAVDRITGGALATEQSDDHLMHIGMQNIYADHLATNGNITVTIKRTENGVGVDLLATGAEDDALTSTSVTYEEAQAEQDAHELVRVGSSIKP